MSNVIFSIGKFSVSWYSVCILVGVVIATIVFCQSAKDTK